jgi:hypothetical protein
MTKSQPDPSIVSLTRQLFGDATFARWNPGSYHDALHAQYVAEVVAAMAGCRKREPARRLFLAQVALLHDADPRPAERPTPASVFRTVEWMWLHKEQLQESLAWTEVAFATALALIARTDFPFDDSPRKAGTMFDGLSPYALYGNLLRRLPAESRDLAFEDGQILRFADQCANYCRDFATASQSVDDLSQEMHNVGRPVSRGELDTAAFIDGLASDAQWDARLSHELGLSGRIYSQAELRHSLSARMQDRLERNRDLFLRERETRQAYG